MNIIYFHDSFADYVPRVHPYCDLKNNNETVSSSCSIGYFPGDSEARQQLILKRIHSIYRSIDMLIVSEPVLLTSTLCFEIEMYEYYGVTILVSSLSVFPEPIGRGNISTEDILTDCKLFGNVHQSVY